MTKTSSAYKKRDALKMKVSQLYLMGFSARKIGEQVGIAHATVYKVIDELEREWDRFWMPAIEKVRSKKVAELNNLKSQIFTSLLILQRENNHLGVKQLGDLILKIIQTENKIYQLYESNYGRQNLGIEDLIAEYEHHKANLFSNASNPPDDTFDDTFDDANDDWSDDVDNDID